MNFYFILHFCLLPVYYQKWINGGGEGGEEVVTYQNSCNLSPKFKMVLNVIPLNYWKFFWPSDTVLLGILTLSKSCM